MSSRQDFLTILNIFIADHWENQLRLGGCLSFIWLSCLPPSSGIVPERGDQSSCWCCQHTSHSSNMSTFMMMLCWTSTPFIDSTGGGELCRLTRSITSARREKSFGMVLVLLSSGHLHHSLGVSCICPDWLDWPWCTYSRTDPTYLCPYSEEAGWILVWGLLGNTNLPSNYLPECRWADIACLAARVTQMWTSATVSHLSRSCTLLPLPPSQSSLLSE